MGKGVTREEFEALKARVVALEELARPITIDLLTDKGRDALVEVGRAHARSDGSTCRDCGGLTVPTGSCSTCTTCGSTGGCG